MSLICSSCAWASPDANINDHSSIMGDGESLISPDSHHYSYSQENCIKTMDKNQEKKLGICYSNTGDDESDIDEDMLGDEYKSLDFEKSDYDFKNASPFTDLNAEIKKIDSNSFYNITRDYAYKDSVAEKALRTGIVIEGDNITINGNDHVIDGQHKPAIFNIKGNSITISNLNFINAGYTEETTINGIKTRKGYSCVNWQGNDGFLYYCAFQNNYGLNGGAISLYGDVIQTRQKTLS